MSSEASTPLTFDLQQDLLSKLKSMQSKTGARSVSELVRYAISVLDESELGVGQQAHCQISVRFPAEVRQRLMKLSKRKKISIGEILRVAIESLADEFSDVGAEDLISQAKITKPKIVKKAAAKAVAKVTLESVSKPPVEDVSSQRSPQQADEKAEKKTTAEKAAKKLNKKAAKAAEKKLAKKLAKANKN
jgi:predicted DNA-binding protein